MREAVLTGYLRTAQSRARPNEPSRDWFHKLRGDDLLAKLLSELIKRVGVMSDEVNDFIIGVANGVSENWTYGGRLPIFLANFSEKVAAKFVDQQCGSSMAAIHIGAMEIMLGYADIVIASGMEHMTRVPRGQSWLKDGHVKINEKLLECEEYFHWDIRNSMNMGLTAEKLFYLTNFTKRDLDLWAIRSHELTVKAQKEGFFDGEILPIQAEQGDGSLMTVIKDQSGRENVDINSISELKPAFKENGVITAGNSSPLNTGASAILLMGKDIAKKRGIKPLATIRSIGFAGVDPSLMGMGPIPATQKALKSAGLSVGDIDYWEINEAFSIVVLNCIKELGIDPERVNIKGGGLAIGHPLGATGCRLVGTLARILNEKEARFGCATACCGGGQGVATIIEREEYNW